MNIEDWTDEDCLEYEVCKDCPQYDPEIKYECKYLNQIKKKDEDVNKMFPFSYENIIAQNKEISEAISKIVLPPNASKQSRKELKNIKKQDKKLRNLDKKLRN